MSEILRNFLVDLATDSKLMNDFIKDRKGALDKWSQGLSHEEKQALLTGNSVKIAELLGTPPHHSHSVGNPVR